jgi:hypothetical protein
MACGKKRTVTWNLSTNTSALEAIKTLKPFIELPEKSEYVINRM